MTEENFENTGTRLIPIGISLEENENQEPGQELYFTEENKAKRLSPILLNETEGIFFSIFYK